MPLIRKRWTNYTNNPSMLEQAVKAMGYEVVWKDWDKIFDR